MDMPFIYLALHFRKLDSVSSHHVQNFIITCPHQLEVIVIKVARIASIPLALHLHRTIICNVGYCLSAMGHDFSSQCAQTDIQTRQSRVTALEGRGRPLPIGYLRISDKTRRQLSEITSHGNNNRNTTRRLHCSILVHPFFFNFCH